MVEECNGDTTKAIVLLTKIQDFNQAMNNSNNNNNNNNHPINRIFNPRQTGNSGGEATVISQQQIPLTINAANNHSLATSQVVQNNGDQQDCCNCGNCCQCCLIKPASYKNGLYRIDYQIYNISFLLFSMFTVYPESILYSLSQSYQGLYLPTIGLLLIFSASFFMFCKKDNLIVDNCNFIRGCMFIFGGLLYLLGYIIHSMNIKDICDDDDDYYNYWDYWDCGYWSEDDITPEPEYLIGRGCFVGFHSIFFGLLYIGINHKLKKCHLHSRIGLIRFWSLLYFIFSLLVLCWIMYPWFYLMYMAFAPIIILIALLLNFCLIKLSNEAGGCNSGVTLGLIIVIAYYFAMLWLTIFIIIKSWIHEEQQGWYLFWDLSILLFGAMQLWILSRAMSPVNANCGCRMHGSGDGNIISPSRHQQLQAQVAGIQLQPQSLVVTTASFPDNDNIAAPPANDEIQIPIEPAAVIENNLLLSDEKGYQKANDIDDDDEGENV